MINFLTNNINFKGRWFRKEIMSQFWMLRKIFYFSSPFDYGQFDVTNFFEDHLHFKSFTLCPLPMTASQYLYSKIPEIFASWLHIDNHLTLLTFRPLKLCNHHLIIDVCCFFPLLLFLRLIWIGWISTVRNQSCQIYLTTTPSYFSLDTLR